MAGFSLVWYLGPFLGSWDADLGTGFAISGPFLCSYIPCFVYRIRLPAPHLPVRWPRLVALIRVILIRRYRAGPTTAWFEVAPSLFLSGLIILKAKQGAEACLWAHTFFLVYSQSLVLRELMGFPVIANSLGGYDCPFAQLNAAAFCLYIAYCVWVSKDD